MDDVTTSSSTAKKASQADVDHENLLHARQLFLVGLVKELSIHFSILQLYVYPLVKKMVSDGAQLEESLLMNLRVMKELALYVDAHHDDTQQVELQLLSATLDKLRIFLNIHIGEEDKILVRLRELLSEQQLLELAKNIADWRERAPTHPHTVLPMEPEKGSGVGETIFGIIDRVKDAFSRESETSEPFAE